MGQCAQLNETESELADALYFKVSTACVYTYASIRVVLVASAAAYLRCVAVSRMHGV